MKVPSEQSAMQMVAERLAELVHVELGGLRSGLEHEVGSADFIVEAGAFTFAVTWKESGAAGPMAKAIAQIQSLTEDNGRSVIGLLVVPFMSEVGRRRCVDANVAWLDLSGNARIHAPGLHIVVEGKPDRYKRRGRPSSPFAPKSSRIARWLLMHPDVPVTQRGLAQATDTGEGYTSRIVGKLEADGLIVRSGNGAITPRDPDLLLDAWGEDYRFSKHHILRGHVAARSGEALLGTLAQALDRSSIEYAATGLAGAWLLDRFAGFRITTLYLADEPMPELLDALSFREEERGANVWLVVPNDAGVFHGAAAIDAVCCAHPVQVYLDLSAHPERADDAAKQLRANHLRWSTDA